MDINTGAQQDVCYRAARFNEKGCLQVWDGDALNTYWTFIYKRNSANFAPQRKFTDDI
jgi:hypothetical protein